MHFHQHRRDNIFANQFFVSVHTEGIFIHTTMEASQNILYGGPDCEIVEADAGSLGDVVQRLLAASSEEESIVC